MEGEAAVDHVVLRAGVRSDGSLTKEVVPCIALGGQRFRLLGSPALVLGCAAGDVLAVDTNGDFSVESRGGNVAVQVFPSAPLQPHAVDDLRTRFADLEAVTERPTDVRFIVVTVPVAVGFETIETLVDEWCSEVPGTTWYYGNVYNESGEPLNWWAQ